MEPDGHGAVVLTIALSVSLLAGRWEVPAWFDTLGALVSIGFLAALGGLNLAAVLRAAPNEIVQPVGLKGRVLVKLRHVSHPFLVALVGALFALSFDTMSQAAFFALTATQFGGWQQALTLALLFMLGMLVTDGINGLWIARLIARADQAAVVASRVPKASPTHNPIEQKQPAAHHPNTARKAQPQLTRQATEDSSSSSFSVPALTEPPPPTQSPRVVSSASAPQFNAAYLNNPAPEYPAVARRRRQQGTTLLDVRVSANGRPLSVEVGRSSGVTALDEAARDAVRGWTFLPAKVGDNPVEGRVEVPIRFHLSD